MKKEKLTFIDLFAGCGGLSEGFLASENFEGLAHVEWEMPMVNTLRKRLTDKWNHTEEDARKQVVYFDIQLTEELLEGSWNEETKLKYEPNNHPSIIHGGIASLAQGKQVDLIIGGPPCQAYSIAGRAQDKNSMKDDYRNYLFESFVKVVDFFKPQAFVFENVPGLLSAKPGNKLVTERIYEAFEAIGYEIRKPALMQKSVYSANDFNTPQKRRRIIIVGVKKDKNIDLEGIYSAIDSEKKENSKMTVKTAIGTLPQFTPLKTAIKKDGKNVSHLANTKEQVSLHTPRFHNTRDVNLFKRWIREKMNSKTSPEKISFYNNIMNKNSNHAKYRNLEWDKPSPTIVAHLYKDGLMFIHPDEEQARSITIREAGCLQSFPKDFEFVGSMGSCYKMIGNAVPPQMAECIAIGISKVLNKG